ncbi:SIK kinase 3 [Mortierella alpina]|nr:SIK kinase 3 [Mortierella alpina]
MLALARGPSSVHPSSAPGSGSSSRQHPAAAWGGSQSGPMHRTGTAVGTGAGALPSKLHAPMTIRLSLHGLKNIKSSAPQSIPATASRESSSLKIRIPRSIPNLPEAFRKRGAIRSQPESTSTTANGPISIKRTHSAMLDTDVISPAASAPASAEATSASKHRSKSKSKSISPQSTPARFPSPAQAASETTVVAISSDMSSSEPTKTAQTTVATVSHSHGTRSADGITQPPAAGSGSVVVGAVGGSTGSTPPSGSTATVPLPGVDPDNLQPIELLRVGMGILDQLLCNTFSKSFINKVPQSVANYHVVIKKPMDLTTIEQKLWKSLELAAVDRRSGPSLLQAAAESLAVGATEGYETLLDFERDLRRIVLNAVYFNSSTHAIYKEAEDFQKLQTKILNSYRQGTLALNIPLAHESYRPELISLSEPGPLYLFRAHTLREMDRKMTDISTDLFSTFHQPIFDISTEQIGQLSPTQPRFVRMYINKNRSVLAKCRDELFARIAILTDVQVGRPYTVSNPSAATGSAAAGNVKSSGGANGATISMVRLSAKVLIGKPIGERHDMITVGDLDCPNSWITVVCVRALEIDLEVPSKFDKGILAKMRHEVVPYSSESKIGVEHQRAFADALGLQLPTTGRAAYAYGLGGQRSAIPALTSTPPLPTSTQSPATPATTITSTPASAGPGSPIVSVSFPKINSSSPVASSAMESTPDSSKNGQKLSLNSWVNLHDEGPTGRYMVKLRIPSSLFKGIHRPPASAETNSASGTGSAIQRIVVSMPSTPTSSQRVHALSSQVPATAASPTSDQESLSAPDRMLLNEQVTKRGDRMLKDLKVAAKKQNVPYTRWSDIEPTLTVDTAHGLFKRIFHVRGQGGLVIQNFKEMDAESFGQRVREVACLLRLRGLEGVGQIQSVIENDEDHLVGLSMTKYAYTLKQYATNARRHPTPCQKLCLVRDMVSAMCDIHKAGLAHRDLSEVNIMVDEDTKERLADQSPRPHVKVIDFGKSVFVDRNEVERWSMEEKVSEEELSLLPLVVLPPDHGYKLYRSILTLPKNKQDHTPLPPLDPRAEDVYSLGVLIWRTFSGKSPWDGTIEDDLKTIRYLVSNDAQIKFQLEREVEGPVSRQLLLHCLTAQAETRWTTQQLKDWLDQPEVADELLKEFEALGGGRKKVRKNLD